MPVASETHVRLSEVLGALSHALDLTEGQPPGHCVRCCYIGVKVGRAIGLSALQIQELYYTLLLKDAGCSSNAARICELYLTDDRSFKHDVKLMGDRLPQVLRFVLSHTGMRAGLAERFRAIINILHNGGEITRELFEARCQQGARIARRLRFGDAVAQGIRALDEHWDGRGKPDGLSGQAIPVYSRIALLAQVVDVFMTSDGPEAALREVDARCGTWFDPQIVSAFRQVAGAPAFWTRLREPDLVARILDLEPAQLRLRADPDYLDDIAAAFADIVDSKSPYTSGHSERVALFTDLIAEEMGHAAEHRRYLKRAALLHDIGKLAVSNTILDKPGKLDDPEWLEMRSHAAHSEAILSRISAFAELARIGGAHHERLDGKGYPRGLTAENICPDTRMVSAADVFDALTADRPYRAAMPVARALEIMRGDVGTALDGRCVAALERGMERSHLSKPAA